MENVLCTVNVCVLDDVPWGRDAVPCAYHILRHLTEQFQKSLHRKLIPEKHLGGWAAWYFLPRG